MKLARRAYEGSSPSRVASRGPTLRTSNEIRRLTAAVLLCEACSVRVVYEYLVSRYSLKVRVQDHERDHLVLKQKITEMGKRTTVSYFGLHNSCNQHVHEEPSVSQFLCREHHLVEIHCLRVTLHIRLHLYGGPRIVRVNAVLIGLVTSLANFPCIHSADAPRRSPRSPVRQGSYPECCYPGPPEDS